MNAATILNMSINSLKQDNYAKVKTKQDDFEKVIGNYSKVKQKNSSVSNNKTFKELNTQEKSDANNKISNKDDKKNSDDIKLSEDNSSYEEKNDLLKNEVENSEQVLTNQEQELDEQINEAIMEIIMAQLNLTPQKINDVLGKLEMNAKDFLEPENIQLFVKEVYNIDNTIELLSDTERVSSIKEIYESINNLKKDIEQLQNVNYDKGIVQPNNQDIENVKNNDNTETQSNNQNSSNKGQENINLVIQKEQGEEQQFIAQKDNSPKETESSIKHLDYNSFAEKLSEKLVSNGSEVSTANMKETNYESIIKQIVDQVKINIKPEITKMEFQLNPEHLGKLSFTISSEKGIISAQFVAENKTVQEAIENQVLTLKQTLNEQGIKVDKVEVVLSSESFNMQQENQQNEQNNNSKKISKIRLNSSYQDEEDEAIEADNNIGDGATVNYIA